MKMKIFDQIKMEDHVMKFNHNMNHIFFLCRRYPPKDEMNIQTLTTLGEK